MAEHAIELCQIRWEVVKPYRIGFFSSKSGSSRFTAYLGSRPIARSDEVPIEVSTRLEQERQFTARMEAAYQQVIQALLTNGWEPLGTDEEGRVMSFRRLPREKAISPANESDTITQLERLSQLKTQGLISDEEFKTAKARLLGL